MGSNEKNQTTVLCGPELLTPMLRDTQGCQQGCVCDAETYSGQCPFTECRWSSGFKWMVLVTWSSTEQKPVPQTL